LATIDVTNAVDLRSALTLAHAGDVISLSFGNYGDVSISGKNFASDVTITSADPAHAAVVSSLSIVNSSGIHLDDVNVQFTPTAATVSWSAAVTIDRSHGITITGGVMTGGPAVNGVAQTATAYDATGNVRGLPAGFGIAIKSSSGVTVSGTDISQFDRGVGLDKAETVTIQDNDIHDLRRTAIAGTGGNLTIEGNYLHDSRPWGWGGPTELDHGDFIALWTDAARTTPESNIVVKDNVMSQGAGSPILGMWLQGGTAGFTNVTISGNAIDIGNFQGISLRDVANGSVTGNTLIQPAGGAQSPTVILQSGAQNIDVSGNLTSSVVDQNSGATGNTIHDNTVVQATNATATGYYTSALLNKIAGLSADQIFSTVQHGVTFVADTAPVGPAVTAQSLLHVAGGTAGSAVTGHYTDDNLVGTAGNDTLNGDGGADTLTGGAGNDTYYMTSATAKIVEAAGGGTDLVVAKGNYTLEANVENLQIDAASGWAGTGNALDNVIVGNAGNNIINGMDGNDTLDGGLGNDQITGGNGNDVLLGGGGSDTLTGSAGADTFVIAQGFGNDKVTDFSQAQGDHILAVGAYTTAQVGADTVVTLATGDHITLAGVSMTTLKAGWISEVDSLFGSAPTAPPPIDDLIGAAGNTGAMMLDPNSIMQMMNNVGLSLFSIQIDL
jgi:Ca2+-binding RTX toxin-like protein